MSDCLTGRRYDLLLAFALDDAAFAVGAFDRDYLADAYLRSLLRKPLEPLDVLRRGDGHDEPVRHALKFVFGRDDPDGAPLGVGVGYLAQMQLAASVGDVQAVADAEAQYPYAVFRFVFVENVLGRYDVRGIE